MAMYKKEEAKNILKAENERLNQLVKDLKGFEVDLYETEDSVKGKAMFEATVMKGDDEEFITGRYCELDDVISEVEGFIEDINKDVFPSQDFSLKDLAGKNAVMAFYVAHVVKGNLSRDIEVNLYDHKSNSFKNITDVVADELVLPVKNGGVHVAGVGMNMTFALSSQIEKYVLDKAGEKVNIDCNGFAQKEKDLYLSYMAGFDDKQTGYYTKEYYDEKKAWVKGLYSEVELQANNGKNMESFAGTPMVTKENFFEVVSGSEFPVEFAFSNNETGCVYEDGRVFFNEQGNELYEFKNTKDAYAFFFGDDEKNQDSNLNFEYKISSYIGNRDDNPTLDEICKQKGIKTLEEEDGSSVYSDWEVVKHGFVVSEDVEKMTDKERESTVKGLAGGAEKSRDLV